MISAIPRFNRKANQEFARTLRSRVNQYFEDNKLARTGDWRLALKAVFMFTLYLAPFGLLLATDLSWWAYLTCSAAMGFGVAGIGLAVMHEANHGSFSPYKWLNNMLGYSLNLIGGNSLSWRIQHNVLHHSFTNVSGFDEDLEAGNIMRFTPSIPWKKHHRGQHIYGWFLYSFMTISWVLLKDFKRIKVYRDRGLLDAQGVNYNSAVAFIAISKVLYLAYIIGLPIAAGYSPLLVVGGFLLMHLLGGLLLAMIFQPAHVMEGHTFVDENTLELEGCYESHQLSTTTNFGAKNVLLTWYCGGLNFQIEHHIFPGISHVHYPAIAPIVEQTAREFDLPYRSIPTFRGALAFHQNTMRKLGQPEMA